MVADDSEATSKAATKVQEAAAMSAGASSRRRITQAAESVARRYFEAIDARDLDGAVALWADGGRDNVRGQVDVLAPEGVRDFLGELTRGDPRPRLRRRLDDDRRRIAARCSGGWPARSPGPGSLGGIVPTGDHVSSSKASTCSGPRRADPGQRRVHRLDGLAAPDRHDAGAGLARRPAAASARSTLRPRDRRASAAATPSSSRGGLGRAGPARPLQRLPDRARGRRDAVRRRHSHDGASARARRSEARRDRSDRPRPCAQRSSRHRARPRRTGLLPRRRRTTMPKAAAASPTGPPARRAAARPPPAHR